ncbi:GspE/PulE/PilB domain-containing protein [Thiovibrio sp. JS02]
MKAKVQLGQLLLEKKLVTQDQINEALRLQVSGGRRLGYLLIKMGYLNDEQLLKALAEQLEVPIINIDEKFSNEVRSAVPRYLCQKYSLIPLGRKNHNILSVAMADPMDRQAIEDIENYTNLVVEASLAKHNEIDRAIKQYIPLSLKDIFNPQSFGLVAKSATALLFIIFVVMSFFAARYVYHEKYGTITMADSSVIYKNHDIMIGVDKAGKFSLLGRGARATGFYSVTFENIDQLKAFLEMKKTDFSEKQYDWINWTISHRIEKTKPGQG